MTLPDFCVHREPVEGVAGSDVEKASVGMKVVYRSHPRARAEVGVIQQVRPRDAFVLYLGDHTAKLTLLADLTLWEGP